ncbi:UPF0481 protein At3g47200-like [Corylus avellana]|uniref:UPF0481 protein At3g47200-like n=1 Tax=Corylus avellana TaxID=13451 RepID=UPI00286C83D0|nr:UPF0481 protein At3g47200-like [Corylus avellana]
MARTEHVISVEELLSRKVNVVRTEAVEVQVIEKDSPSRQQRLDRLEKAGGGDSSAQNEGDQKVAGPKIQKVSFLVRDNKNVAKYFEPRVVSLGPIHHGNPKYNLAEEYKLGLANKFVKESGKTAGSLYAKIEEKISKLREYFDGEVTKEYDDECLAWMLFVDGCAVLQFMYYAVEEKFKDVKIKNDLAAFGQQDLFLLENQLPYQLLEDLMELSDNKETLKNSIDSFIENHANCKAPKNTSTEKPAHLLDRLRTRLLCKVPVPRAGDHKGKKKKEADWQSYRNVQELRAAGIQLKPSKTNSLIDLHFSDQNTFYPGYLHLPQITVDDSTGPMFLNLIAYEGCPDFENDFGVTSYVCFLDTLIDHPADVKELRNAHILHNLLGSDKEVSQLFNDIATDLVPNPKTYADVKNGIQKCYDSKWKTWIAQAIHDHFSSPWTFVGFLAAFLALALTVLQTWYSVRGSPSDTKDRSPPAPRIPKRY